MPEKKRYTYEVFRPASEMSQESDAHPWDERIKKPRRLTRAAQLAVNHGTFAFRGLDGAFLIRPHPGWLTLPEVRDVVALFYGRPVSMRQVEDWTRENVGPPPETFKLKGIEYDFYPPRKIIEWLEMSERCRNERAWGRTEGARSIESGYGYGAIPNQFTEAPSQGDRHGNPVYKDLSVAPEHVRQRFEKATAAERKREERLRHAKLYGYLSELYHKQKMAKKKDVEELKRRKARLATRQSLTTEPEDASTPPVPITPSRHEDTPDD